jgi:tetratricopeptide (TPR) repeat protein
MFLLLMAAALLSDDGAGLQWREQLNCGNENFDKGRLQLAEKCFHSALEIAEGVPGNFWRVGTALGSLSAILLEQGRLSEAEAAALRAIETLRGCKLKGCGSALGRATRNLAIVYTQQNRLAEAADAFTDVLGIYARDGVALTEVVSVVNSLGLLEMNRSRPAAAESQFRRGLLLSHNVTSANLIRSDLYAGLSTALLAQGRNTEAIIAAKLAFVEVNSAGSPDYYRIIYRACALGAAACASGQYDDAERALEMARTALAKIPSAAPRELALVLSETGKLRLSQKRLEESAALYRQAIDALAIHVSADHPQMLSLRATYAFVLRKLKRPKEAEQVESEAHELSPKSPSSRTQAR